MRWPALVVVVVVACLGACQDERNGAYLMLDGADVPPFDRVTFYFGKSGEAAPVRLPHPQFEAALGTRQFVFERARVPSDSQNTTGSTFTYYLDAASRNLGAYMVAIAYDGATPVGITELIDFEVPSDVAYIYELALVRYDPVEVQRWGRLPQDDDECVRWTRFRDGDDPDSEPSTVVVGRDHDRDCDAYDDRVTDCDPHAYCDPTDPTSACTSGACLIDGTDGGPPCQLGTCTNEDGVVATCAPVACLVEAACRVCPADGQSPGERASCAVIAIESHIDFQIPVQDDGTLCTNPYTFSIIPGPGVACTEPLVELSMSYPPGELAFAFRVSDEQGACKIEVTQTVADATFSDVTPHLVITFGGDITVGGPRPSFVVGISSDPGAPLPCEPIIDTLESPLGFCLASTP